MSKTKKQPEAEDCTGIVIVIIIVGFIFLTLLGFGIYSAGKDLGEAQGKLRCQIQQVETRNYELHQELNKARDSLQLKNLDLNACELNKGYWERKCQQKL